MVEDEVADPVAARHAPDLVELLEDLDVVAALEQVQRRPKPRDACPEHNDPRYPSATFAIPSSHVQRLAFLSFALMTPETL